MTPVELPGYQLHPIGFVRSPFAERAQAPRQGRVARDVAGRVELLPGRGYDHALDGLAEWDYAWLLFVFHRNVVESRGWKAKVLPPRSSRKRGVFATRSPHRPNPIGLTAVRIERVEDLVVHVRGLDLIDGTPVLDIKPYVAYADAIPAARAGWLEPTDPLPPWRVRVSEAARIQLDWLAGRGVDLFGPIEASLTLGPTPRPYRRIRVLGDGLELAVKDWRVDFAVDGAAPSQPAAPRDGGRSVLVRGVRSGYRARDVAESPELFLHREFAERFGVPRL